jgi:hypothetical protein
MMGNNDKAVMLKRVTHSPLEREATGVLRLSCECL